MCREGLGLGEGGGGQRGRPGDLQGRRCGGRWRRGGRRQGRRARRRRQVRDRRRPWLRWSGGRWGRHAERRWESRPRPARARLDLREQAGGQPRQILPRAAVRRSGDTLRANAAIQSFDADHPALWIRDTKHVGGLSRRRERKSSQPGRRGPGRGRFARGQPKRGRERGDMEQEEQHGGHDSPHPPGRRLKARRTSGPRARAGLSRPRRSCPPAPAQGACCPAPSPARAAPPPRR